MTTQGHTSLNSPEAGRPRELPTCDGSAVCLASERDHFSYCRSQMTWANLDRLEAAEAACDPENADERDWLHYASCEPLCVRGEHTAGCRRTRQSAVAQEAP
jgi:hypothetical protein